MNEISSASQPSSTETSQGCLSQIGWLFSGFVMPLGSFTFYRKAAQKSVGGAILFFFLFTFTLSLIASLDVGHTLFSMGTDIQSAFDNGSIPEIIIRHGTAEVKGEQPLILIDTYAKASNRTFIAIDTTGTINAIDRSRYDSGFLLKKHELVMLDNNGRYQTLPLSELNSYFSTDPIIINAETTKRGWNVFSIVAAVVVFIALIIWNSIVRLMFISMLALVLWGVVSLIRPNTGFGPIIISGIYALVPVIYIHHLLSRANLSFFSLQTILFMPLWLIVLFITLTPVDFFARERSLRLWRTLIGLPLLIVMTFDTLIKFRYGIAASWIMLLLTVIALAIPGILARAKENQPPAPSA